MMGTIWPQPLTNKDRIHFTAPSRGVEDEVIQAGRKFFEPLVSEIKVSANTGLMEDDPIFQQLAGSDTTRVEAVNRALADEESKAVICVTGGFGATRVLKEFDYESLKAHPKLICGFSDITALHAAVYKMTGMVSLHSPNLDSLPLRDMTQDAWISALRGNLISTESPEFEAFLTDGPLETWQKGVAEGVLIGGNLSLMAAVEGTPFALPRDRDIVLFLEDIGEAATRVDMMLHQLLLAGAFQRVQGLILGYFTKRKAQKNEPPDLITETLQAFCQKLNIPVLTNFPVGHIKNNLTVAHGAQVWLNTEKQSLHYLNCPW